MRQENQDQIGHPVPWNKGKLIGQKSPLKLKEIWAIRIRLQMIKNIRVLALFNLAIDKQAPRMRFGQTQSLRRCARWTGIITCNYNAAKNA